MWDHINNDPCEDCQCRRTKKSRCEGMSEEYLDKENMQSFSPIKTDELSMYESNSPLSFTASSSHCSHDIIRRPLEDHDSNSQDSGYGASYSGEHGKFLSRASPTRTSMSFGSMCCMEEEYLDFSDVEPLEKLPFPQDFNKLISNPFMPRSRHPERNSPKDTIIRPLLRRALSLQNANVTPNSSRVRTSLFRGGEAEIRSFKRPEPPTSESETSTGVKKLKIFEEEEEEASVPQVRPILQRPFSATEESIMCAVQRSSTEPDLIGDFSKNFCLPLTRCRHQDLKAITSATLVQLLKGDFTDRIASFKIIDCRYPYEFEGGHIDGAVNIYTKEQCLDLLHAKEVPLHTSQKRHVLIFHCEFSSERGPNLYRYLRKEDRHKNESAYPSLHYPEIYLLEGGYKNFFEQFSDMCTPVAYKEMLHPAHEQDLRHFRQKSKTWNCDSRQRPQYGRGKRLI